MERWAAKLIAMIVTFVITLFFTLLPIKVAKIFTRWGQVGTDILSHCMCFGGGVFFSIFILHMLPDVERILHDSLLQPNDITYPLPHLIIGLGFFVMMFMERFTLVLNEQRHNSHHDKDKGKDVSHSLMHLEEEQLGPKNGTTIFSHDKEQMHNITKVGQGHQVGDQISRGKQDDDKVGYRNNNQGHGHSHDAVDLRGARSLILLLALSLHHVFEGMTVGLKHTIAGVWSLCAAILAHEIIIAFSLGLQLVKSTKKIKMVVAAAFTCSVMLPIGVVIGMVITETGKTETNSMNIVNGILQGIATGVFIYVTFFEIIYTELSESTIGFAKLLTMFSGFVVMALLGLIPEDKTSGFPENSVGNISSVYSPLALNITV